MSVANLVWDDGRSGEIGILAGNIALRHVANGASNLQKEKGTIFSTDDTIFVGRVSTENYLTGATVHWANVSWDQHSELLRQARRQKKSLRYLFVTAAAPAEIRIWLVPGSLVETSIRQRGKDRIGNVMAVHIVASKDRFLLGQEDVTAFFTSVQLTRSEISSLQRLLAQRADSVGLAANQQPSSNRISAAPTPLISADRLTSFEIPVAGARTARLSVPLPLSAGDLSRIKGWVDLMSDVLIEDPAVATEQAMSTQREWLRSQVEAGVRQLDRGKGVDGEAAIARILDRSAAIAADQK